MKYLFNPAFFIVMSIFISSCGSVIQHPDNKPVRLIFQNDRLPSIEKSECEYLGHIVGSHGRWFTYLFISNDDLTYGALLQNIHQLMTEYYTLLTITKKTFISYQNESN